MGKTSKMIFFDVTSSSEDSTFVDEKKKKVIKQKADSLKRKYVAIKRLKQNPNTQQSINKYKLESIALLEKNQQLANAYQTYKTLIKIRDNKILELTQDLFESKEKIIELEEKYKQCEADKKQVIRSLNSLDSLIPRIVHEFNNVKSYFNVEIATSTRTSHNDRVSNVFDDQHSMNSTITIANDSSNIAHHPHIDNIEAINKIKQSYEKSSNMNRKRQNQVIIQEEVEPMQPEQTDLSQREDDGTFSEDLSNSQVNEVREVNDVYDFEQDEIRQIEDKVQTQMNIEAAYEDNQNIEFQLGPIEEEDEDEEDTSDEYDDDDDDDDEDDQAVDDIDNDNDEEEGDEEEEVEDVENSFEQEEDSDEITKVTESFVSVTDVDEACAEKKNSEPIGPLAELKSKYKKYEQLENRPVLLNIADSKKVSLNKENNIEDDSENAEASKRRKSSIKHDAQRDRRRSQVFPVFDTSPDNDIETKSSIQIYTDTQPSEVKESRKSVRTKRTTVQFQESPKQIDESKKSVFKCRHEDIIEDQVQSDVNEVKTKKKGNLKNKQPSVEIEEKEKSVEVSEAIEVQLSGNQLNGKRAIKVGQQNASTGKANKKNVNKKVLIEDNVINEDVENLGKNVSPEKPQQNELPKNNDKNNKLEVNQEQENEKTSKKVEGVKLKPPKAPKSTAVNSEQDKENMVHGTSEQQVGDDETENDEPKKKRQLKKQKSKTNDLKDTSNHQQQDDQQNDSITNQNEKKKQLDNSDLTNSHDESGNSSMASASTISRDENNESVGLLSQGSSDGRTKRIKSSISYKEINLNCKMRRDNENKVCIKKNKIEKK